MGQLTLAQYQRLFNQATVHGEQDELPSTLLDFLIPGGTLTAPDALAVYAKGYIVRLTESLGDTFEAVWWVCGDENFFQLAKRYIRANPSMTYNLSQYGEQFPEFLDILAPFPDLPFLGDLARYEWLFNELFHAAQHEPIAPDRIQSAAEDTTLCFHFGRAVRLFTSPFAVYDLWKLRNTPHEGTPPAEWNHPQSLLLYKQNQQIFVKDIDEAEFALLTALRDGQSLETALTATADKFPDFSQEQISTVFQMIVHTGIIERIESADSQ